MATAMYLRFEKSQFLQICLTYMNYYEKLDIGKLYYIFCWFKSLSFCLQIGIFAIYLNEVTNE